MLTCSHTLSSISISRNLYIGSSWLFVFCFLAVCQMGAFLSSFSPFGLSEMYWPQGLPLLYTERLTTPVYSRGGACPRPGTAPITPKVRAYGASPCGCPGMAKALVVVNLNNLPAPIGCAGVARASRHTTAVAARLIRCQGQATIRAECDICYRSIIITIGGHVLIMCRA